jgi:D-serine deaminase-like pyridoxal phosphate-dependent protein
MNPNTRGYAVLTTGDAHASALYEEHAVLEGGAALAGLEVGDRVELVPNHACVTANLHGALVLRRGDEVVDTLALDARGWRRED